MDDDSHDKGDDLFIPREERVRCSGESKRRYVARLATNSTGRHARDNFGKTDSTARLQKRMCTPTTRTVKYDHGFTTASTKKPAWSPRHHSSTMALRIHKGTRMTTEMGHG